MTVGTRPAPVIAAFLSLVPDRLRDWRRRGLIGPTCDVRTRQEGYDVAEVARIARTRRPAYARPRVVLDNQAWRSHAERVR